MDRQLIVMREGGRWFEWNMPNIKIPDTLKASREIVKWLEEDMNASDVIFAAFKYENPKGEVSRVSYTLPEGEEVEIKQPDLPSFLDDNMIRRWVEFRLEGVDNIKIERSE